MFYDPIDDDEPVIVFDVIGTPYGNVILLDDELIGLRVTWCRLRCPITDFDIDYSYRFNLEEPR